MDFDFTDTDAEISALLSRCSPDERRVVRTILRRIDRARPTYGPLDIATDRRDWARERRQEMADWLVYDALDDIARGYE